MSGTSERTVGEPEKFVFTERVDTLNVRIVNGAVNVAGAQVKLTSVSGQIAIRIPEPRDAEVDANTTSGPVSCAFDELRVTGQWGPQRITGRIGGGSARLRATTVSGAIALLRRPPLDDARDAADGPNGPGVPGGELASLRKDI
ncbi:DUF4097 family beta strand repeat-containing protein [Actinacidiphila sp. ITFR-21]|uniref:DUF4097 family beta strand repeat-containing protein n=1 Tax=Actinacidiphila sp. ITFR-21 TaxID=3075199 RepID=UPI00288BF98F|nr:DUF4097 family beta strand repeat-containing protein [Streptomyces sp. ITFR-21]WNI17943.1 DUF4097 family beta strand repeat-containing protein [Streptomyces sp. ITFR-21]